MTAAPAEIWRQRLWVWVPALAFLAINCLGLAVYHFGYANRVKTLQLDVQDEHAKLAAAQAERQRLENQLRQARVNRERILELYDEHFSTRRRRLTGVTAEVNSLARRAGLLPRSISFPEEQIQQYGLIKRSFLFSVEGTYTDLRKFINLIELSDSFLTLESTSLSGADAAKRGGAAVAGLPQAPAFVPGLLPGPPPPPGEAPGPPGSPLRISLALSTLFAAQDEPKDALAPLPGVAATGRPGAPPPRARSTP
jgi:type IV pilus assembly protein PilO